MFRGRIRSVRSFNSSRWRLEAENVAFAASVPTGARVLDAGAGSGPYRSHFLHADYESADFELVDKPYGETTYVCDLSAIPVEDERFDFIIFNQVMEHLPDPLSVLRELNRVLRPGGRLLYSAPLTYEEHEQPYDYYRYTQFGVRYLFVSAGFEVERLDWLEGYYATVAYQLSGMARDLPSRPNKTGVGSLGLLVAPAMMLARLLFGMSSIAFHRLEKLHKYRSAGYPKNYVAIVVKEDRSE